MLHQETHSGLSFEDQFTSEQPVRHTARRVDVHPPIQALLSQRLLRGDEHWCPMNRVLAGKCPLSVCFRYPALLPNQNPVPSQSRSLPHSGRERYSLALCRGDQIIRLSESEWHI